MKPLEQLHLVESILRDAVENILKEIRRVERSTPTPIEHASIWNMRKGVSQLEYAYLHVSGPNGRTKQYIGRDAARIAATRQAIANGDALTALKANLAKCKTALANFEQIAINASRNAVALTHGLPTGDPKQRQLPL